MEFWGTLWRSDKEAGWVWLEDLGLGVCIGWFYLLAFNMHLYTILSFIKSISFTLDDKMTMP